MSELYREDLDVIHKLLTSLNGITDVLGIDLCAYSPINADYKGQGITIRQNTSSKEYYIDFSED